MASDQQVALSRPQRGASSHLNRTARQVVPAFLQKLYEMVNDSANDSLIRWSDTGDSFFVLDHERFAREVLGRWFKHQNFSSFVRQLNMYGFHKIPHLQQGVLRSDADAEFWNFEHPSFHRGQPDLLCLIQRKKQAAQTGEDSLLSSSDPHHYHTQNTLHHSAPTPAAPTPATALSAGQLLDINAIVSGIAAIKRHQSTISSELAALKAANAELWREARLARERHSAQQDTIARILKFLAGVFGPGMPTVRTPSDATANATSNASTPRAVAPRAPQRLMIEQGPRNELKARAVRVAEVEDADMPPTPQPADSPSDAPRFSPAPSDGNPPFSPIATNDSQQPFSSDTSILFPTPLTPRAASTPPADAAMHAAFADALSAPGQVQRLLAALAAHPSFPLPPADTADSTTPAQLTPYTPFDFAPALPAPPEEALPDPRLVRGYEDAAAIARDVDGLSANINSLIASLGLAPSDLSAPAADPPADPPPVSPGASPDFDFDRFFNAFSVAEEGAASVEYSGGMDGAGAGEVFMDEASPPASPTTARAPSPEYALRRAPKRKSDAAGEAPSLAQNDPQGGRRAKRKC